jgi:hypothetical protein
MRWRIPLVVALVAFVAVGCDQQSTEPVHEQVTTAPALFGVNGAESSRWDFTFPDVDMCGYDIADCELTSHVVVHDRLDAGHWRFHSTWNGTCTGQSTGERWRFRDQFNQQSQFDWEDFAPDVFYIGNSSVLLIGQGQTPNFKARAQERYTVNANGELVSYKAIGFFCVEPGS